MSAWCVLFPFFSLLLHHVSCDDFLGLDTGRGGGMKLGSFQEERNLFESNSLNSKHSDVHEASSSTTSSEVCSAGCDEKCDDSCDLFWIYQCDESCDSGCDTDSLDACGDVEAQIKWYNNVETHGGDLEQDIIKSRDEAKIAYDCYDEQNLFQESQFSQEYLAEHGVLHPHIIRKQEIISKLAAHGLNYGHYRKARLQDVPEESLQRYFNMNSNELELLLTESYEFSVDVMSPKFNIHPNSGYGCSSAYVDFFNELELGFEEIDESVENEEYNTGLLLGVGWEVQLLVYAFGEEIGIAISNSAVGLYVDIMKGFQLLQLGVGYYGSIAFDWDYEHIPGTSRDVSTDAGFDFYGLSLSFGFENGDEWKDLTFGFGFDLALLDIIPFTIAWPEVVTVLMDIKDLVNFELPQTIHGLPTDTGGDDDPPRTVTITISDDVDFDEFERSSRSYFDVEFWRSWSHSGNEKDLLLVVGLGVFAIAILGLVSVLVYMCCGKCGLNKMCNCQSVVWNVKNSDYELLDNQP